MKFTADKKDFLIFIAFSAFLLYIVAILILNVSSLAQLNMAHGLNPFPAFTADYIFTTLTFYLIFYIVIVMSVKKYFFDTEKGFGFSKSASNGFSRWASVKEIKERCEKVIIQDKKLHAAGIPLLNNGVEAYVDNGESHSLVLGATGSGKTTMIIFPMAKILIKKGESMVITDPKGEIYQKTANILKAYGYKVVVLNFREPLKGNGWNPLALPYEYYKSGNTDKANELLNDLAINILYEQSNNSADPFWEKTAADYFSGLILGLFADANENEINLNSVSLMSTVGEDKFGGSTYIKEYFNAKDPSSPEYASVASTIMAPNDTKNSILSVFKQKIKSYTSKEQISEMLSFSDFSMSDIGREKTAVFIVIHDEKTTYHPLATTFIKQCYESLIDVAQANGGKLPIRTNFLLDEFANMPPFSDITTMITAARSRQIRFNLMIQNFAQLDEVYGEHQAETIRGNCQNFIFIITGELKALEEVSKLCGEIKVKVKGSEGKETRPLISISELQTMPRNTIIIKKQGLMPFKTRLTPEYEINWKMNKYKDAEFVSREKRAVHMFDIKEFVKNQKKEKLFASLEEGESEQKQIGNDPFAGLPFSKPNPNNDDFDVDELVKKIDAKIAALEEEERIEKEKLAKQQNIPKEKINQTSAPEQPVSTNEVTDDQFFDDFFE